MFTQRLVLSALVLMAAPAMADVFVAPNGARQALPYCGGTVETKASRNGDLNLVFRDVRHCDRFDIVEASGGRTNGSEDSRLQFQGNGFGGSRTLPQRLIDGGRNFVKIKLHGNGRYDFIHLAFRADRDGDVVTQPTRNCQAAIVADRALVWENRRGTQVAGSLIAGSQVRLLEYDRFERMAKVYVVSDLDILSLLLGSLQGETVWVSLRDTNLADRCQL